MIHIILGPMYSGKTFMLFELYEKIGGLILDYSELKCQTGLIVNHDKKEHTCISLSRLDDIVTIVHSTIFINEAQFFPDLLEFVKKWESKDIYLFGLDGDFQRNPMGQILQVIPLCDSVKKLRGKCCRCDRGSVFSKRITSDMNPYLLDEKAYIPLCRKCYLTYNGNFV
jgi:thymidine kinase